MAYQENLTEAGLSERQAAEHIKLYEGYVKKIEEIREKIKEAEKAGNAVYSEIRELKIEEGFCINAIKLHELYFENLEKKEIAENLKSLIEKDFESFENWKKEFSACALSARGWALLAYDFKDNKLHNYICDMHNQGGIWNTIPMLVLDMYEHAFFIDYGTDKKSYISLFFDNINWEIAEKRLNEKNMISESKKWDELADEESIRKTADKLKENNIEVFLVSNKEEAKKKILELVPEGSEVMAMSSMTLEETGISKEINESGKFNSVMKKLYSMDRKTQEKEMNSAGAAPDFAIGSVHAITEQGELIIASATGSQLPAYAYSAGKVIFVVGSQKIVKDKEEGMKRIYEYVLPLEDERAKKVYGAGSSVNKLLIINKEIKGRITILIAKEKLGF